MVGFYEHGNRYSAITLATRRINLWTIPLHRAVNYLLRQAKIILVPLRLRFIFTSIIAVYVNLQQKFLITLWAVNQFHN
jgi:uncharacterized iron-regulated membrane protein